MSPIRLSGRVTLASLVCLLTLACGSRSQPEVPTPSAEPPIALAIEPGDAVEVQVWRETDVSGTYSVDDRGNLTLPLLGVRTVTSLTPDSLRTLLEVEYSDYFQTPSVQVTILRRLRILGEVRNPGLYPVDATISVADAIALAGGLLPQANPNDIRLIRGDTVIRQDLDQSTIIGSTEIRSGDQILVGAKGWASQNSGAIIAGLLAATGIIAAAFIAN